MKVLLISIFYLGIYCKCLLAQNIDTEAVSMVLLNRKPIISVKINGTLTYLLVDTGSDISILNEQQAFQLGFIPVSSNELNYQVQGLDGKKQNLKMVKNCKITLGNYELKTRFYTKDLSKLLSSVRSKTHISVQGIIGSDIMKKYDFRLDYNANVIEFSTAQSRQTENQNLKLKHYLVLNNGVEDLIGKQLYK